jgi:NADPH:quinone reductase-like Zn-dependent oxidoreductase
LEQSGEGVDLVVEVGGVGTLPRSLRALKMGGTIAQIGVLSEPDEPMPLPVILHKQARLRGIYVGSRQDFLDMNKAITLTQMRPVGEDFPWTHAHQVLARMEEASHFGKLVMSVS